MTDSGVRLHDIMGAGVLAVLLIIGVLFHKRQHRHVASSSLSEGTPVDRTFARVQIWILYWLAVGATVAFFFLWPRADSRIPEPTQEENAKGQKVG